MLLRHKEVMEKDGRIQVEVVPAEEEIRLVEVGLKSQLRIQSFRQLKGREGTFAKSQINSGSKD